MEDKLKDLEAKHMHATLNIEVVHKLISALLKATNNMKIGKDLKKLKLSFQNQDLELLQKMANLQLSYLDQRDL